MIINADVFDLSFYRSRRRHSEIYLLSTKHKPFYLSKVDFERHVVVYNLELLCQVISYIGPHICFQEEPTEMEL